MNLPSLSVTSVKSAVNTPLCFLRYLLFNPFPEIPPPSLETRRFSSENTNAMKTLHAEVPDLLLQELNELAKNQGASVDHLVSLALTAQVSAWRTRESIASRAKRVDWKQVDEILARVPDAPPLPGDEILK